MKRGSVAIFVPHLGCPHRCSFCDQHAISGQMSPPAPLDVAKACDTALLSGITPEQSEIAFFGGSFTAIPRDYMISLLDAAQPYLKAGFRGIRLSTRPDCITAEILDILKKYGVTSIELGAQSTDNTVLAKNGRGHTFEDTVTASNLVKSYNFTLGLQMMVGLYGSDRDKDIQTARDLIALKPSEARIYPTVILKNTALEALYNEGMYKPYPFDKGVDICAEILEMFETAGISVIKLGLHASRDVEKSMIGGLYHPAFREICESLIYRKKMENLLASDKSATFTVPEKELSKALGQHKSNIEYFSRRGIDVKIIPFIDDFGGSKKEVRRCI